MATKQIIYVPGKNSKPEAALHRALLWRTLVEGVRRADNAVAETLQASYPQFHLVSWNHLYYHAYKNITSDIPWIDALINKHGPLTLADHIPLLIRLLPEETRSTAHEIDRYFDNTDDVARKIRDLLKQTLRPMLEKQDDVLLIGHSLGSVVAYDTLWDLHICCFVLMDYLGLTVRDAPCDSIRAGVCRSRSWIQSKSPT